MVRDRTKIKAKASKHKAKAEREAEAKEAAQANAWPLPPESFGALGATESVFNLIPGLSVETIDLSCCGMAVSFGYRTYTIDTSLAMGELSLLPAVRRAKCDAVVVADGTSCRHQHCRWRGCWRLASRTDLSTLTGIDSGCDTSGATITSPGAV
jgi:hypothetical protein